MLDLPVSRIFSPAFHHPQEEQLAAFIPPLLSPLLHGVGCVLWCAMGSWRSWQHVGNHQHFCSRSHVFLFFLDFLQARAEEVGVVEEAHHSDSVGETPIL
jgi:hypothetical protein